MGVVGRSHPEFASDERSPAPMLQALRRAHRDRGGGGYWVDREQDMSKHVVSSLDMLNRLYAEEGPFSPLPEDRTGGLRFREGVPDALLHLSRNNLSALARLSERIERERHHSVVAAGKLEDSGSRAALASLLYWNATSIPMFLIAESLGL